MEAYTAFASVYDKFMGNVPYDRWADFLNNTISKYGISKPFRGAVDVLESERNIVLDLGCGTGVLTRMMYDKGYDVMGVDISQEMLEEAMSHNKGDYSEILYLCQDMCELDLYSTIGTVYSSCDSINYLIEDEEIKTCFSLVSNYLYPGGLFIFDFNTIHKYRDVIGDRTIAEDNEDCSFIWDNFFDEEASVNEYDLTLFIKENDDLYRKSTETHYQRGYEIDEVCDFLEKSGLKVCALVDEGSLDEAMTTNLMAGDITKVGISENSERIFVIAKKEK